MEEDTLHTLNKTIKMGDVIFYTIAGVIFLLNVATLYVERNNDNSVYRLVYLERKSDWLRAIGLIFLVITTVALIYPFIPDFLNSGLYSGFTEETTNVNIVVITETPKFVSLFFYAFLLYILPKAAFWEEEIFRKGQEKITRGVIFTNLKFGFLHCLLGIPFWAGFVLSAIGLIYSVRYISVFKKHSSKNYSNAVAHSFALDATTSLHAKYNIILVTIIIIGNFL